ncbi:probable GPI-anchored adhesin-like protein PGA55 isoform X2 [Haliotis rufescens]|uniref:probable GPI-anchored adhesin-like protein PGA55 isoform X2 n=1 Tax=Haliotis rufescens TaxID=6454 RepID=UPI00201F74EF|nr:probable GPI-anchored adhesin-like protein PGA55 isoform X2 [Haliotis rufescens]
MGQVLSRKRSASANITAHKSDDVTTSSNGDVVKAEANGSAIQSTGNDTKVEVTDTDAAPVKEKKKRRRFFFSLKRSRPGSGRKKKAKKDRNGQVNADTSANSGKSGLFMDEFQIPEDDGIDSVSLSSNEEKDNKKGKDSGVAIRRSKRNSNSKNGKKKKKKSEKKKEEKSKKKKTSKDEDKSNVVVTGAGESLNITQSVEPLHESVKAAADEAKVLALSEENGSWVPKSEDDVEEDLVAAVTAVMDSSVSEGKMEVEPAQEEVLTPSTATDVATAPSIEEKSLKEEDRERTLKPIVESSAQEETIQSVATAAQAAAPCPETSDGIVPSSPDTDVVKQAVSPAVSNAGENGVLKRVSLGPRLKTAILKKYSGAGDAQPETRVTLTKPKIVEVTDLVPPPRKNRPRRTLSQTTSSTSSSELNTSISSSVCPSSPKTDEDKTVSSPEKSDVESVVTQTLQAGSELDTSVSSNVDPPASNKDEDIAASSSETTSSELNTSISSSVDPSSPKTDEDKTVSTPEKSDVESVDTQTLQAGSELDTSVSSNVDPPASIKDEDIAASSSETTSSELNTSISSSVDPSSPKTDEDKTVSTPEKSDVESVDTQTLQAGSELDTSVSSDVDPAAAIKDEDIAVSSSETSDVESVVTQTLQASSELNTSVSSGVYLSAAGKDEDTAVSSQGKSDIEIIITQELQPSSELRTSINSDVSPPSPRTDEYAQVISPGKTDIESNVTQTVDNVVESQITATSDIDKTDGDGSVVNDVLASSLDADVKCLATETVLAPTEVSVTLAENERESVVEPMSVSQELSRDGADSEVASNPTLAEQAKVVVDHDIETKMASLSVESNPKGETKDDSTPASESVVETSVTGDIPPTEHAEEVGKSVTSQLESRAESVQPDALNEGVILKDIEICIEPTRTYEAETENHDTDTEPVIVIERIHSEPYFGPVPESEDGQSDDTKSGEGVTDLTDAKRQKFSHETGEVCKECICDEVHKEDDEVTQVKDETIVGEVGKVDEEVSSTETESTPSDRHSVSATAETTTQASDETQEESAAHKDAICDTGLRVDDPDDSSSTGTDSTVVDEDEHDRTIVEEKNTAKEPEKEDASDERDPAICNGDSKGLAHESGSDSSSSVRSETSRDLEECTDTVAHEGDGKVVVDCNDEHSKTAVGKVNGEHNASSESGRDISDNNNSKDVISSEQMNILETNQKVSDPILSENHTAAAETVAGE